MLINIDNAKYIIRSIFNFFQVKKCPYCNGSNLTLVDSKFFFTKLLYCNDCSLNHRHPKDSTDFYDTFYNEDYSIDNALMTKLPNDEEIIKLKNDNFESLGGYNRYIKSLSLDKGSRLLDYGCSWGYYIYQFSQMGLESHGFELSKPRAKFGRDKLGVKITSSLKDIQDNYDVFFSSHVIEHLPDLNWYIDFAKQKLNNEGYFIAFCPSGNNEYKLREPITYRGSWGLIHINLINANFYKKVFKQNPYYITTGDWNHNEEKIAQWDKISQYEDPVKDGKELFIIARPNIKLINQN